MGLHIKKHVEVIYVSTGVFIDFFRWLKYLGSFTQKKIKLVKLNQFSYFIIINYYIIIYYLHIFILFLHMSLLNNLNHLLFIMMFIFLDEFMEPKDFCVMIGPEEEKIIMK